MRTHKIWKAEFEVIHDQDKIVILQDLDGPKSITNDIDSVYSRVCSLDRAHNKRIFYFDSYGDSAEILPYGMGTIDINPLPYKTIEELREYVTFEKLT